MARLAIRMPKMSMTMTEGEVGTWSASVGDVISEGDVVAEVMTDKVDMEVESTVSGTLVEIVATEGDVVPVGEPMGWVEGEDDGGGFGDLLSEPQPEPEPEPEPQPEPELPTATSDVLSEPAPAEPSAEAPTTAAPTEPEPEPAVEPEVGIVPAVPRARGLARERGVDLSAVTPTGPDGLVRVPDVEAVLGAAASPATAAPAAPAAVPTPAPAAPAASPAAAKVAAGGHADARRTAVRRAVARAMVPSASIPQFTVWRTLHLDAADVTRHGLSWTTVLLRAYAAGLREVPELLSRWEDDGPTEPAPPCVAVAVATDRGLLVPTFAEPDVPAAAEVDAELRAVVAQAQGGKVDPSHMAPANASLSNLGGLGVDRFQALLTPPQASVLALGAVGRRPVAVPGGLGTALVVEAGLTVDHRVADGAHAARLLAAVQARLGGTL
ncbi:2-oxo acid dehydrogenase subunit E2 [Nocardioides lentus]|uniref:Dihydrolipoamide acetyltransferase component of pyruvate dehydrogenase complex n=1 Tax=Nocardioides lentus TaxID=338077 RepID=A0ABN2PBB4_9ACTN